MARICKGKKQLTWSNGLRQLLKIGQEKSDAEIVDKIPENITVYATFTLDNWRKILRHDLRGEILSNAGYMLQDEFANWIGGILDNFQQ